MSVVVKRNEVPFTYRDYASWPANERWELIDGVAYDMCAAPSRRHQGISVVLSMYFSNYFKGKPCEFYHAPFDVILPDEDSGDWRDSITVVQPDLVVICDKSKLTDEGCLGAPDLVVEIISPYTSKKDIKEKFDLYEREGVREYWIVYPGDRAVQVYALTEEGYYDEGRIFDLSGRRARATKAAIASEAARPSGTAGTSGAASVAVNSVLFPDLSVPLEELFAE